MRQILHIDMDAFYASVEQRDRPELQGKPVAVGGDSPRSVVAAASYEARPFGVRSAMPMLHAKRRCPSLVVVPVRMSHYVAVSAQIFEIFRRYSPLVEGLSLDEAFIDVSGSERLFGSAKSIASRIKEEIYAELGLRASAGVASSKFVAKIASDLEKPDGLTVMPPYPAKELQRLPIKRMWGLGPRACERLHKLGFTTFADLQNTTPDVLVRLLGTWGRQVHDLAHGRDDREVKAERIRKSIGAENTFEKDKNHPSELEPQLLQQAERIAEQLQRKQLLAGNVSVKLKDPDFKVQSKQNKLAEPVCDTVNLFEHAKKLLAQMSWPTKGVRLCGLSASDLVPRAQEQRLFADAQTDKNRKLDEVAFALKKRYGPGTLKRATQLKPDDS
ncbi:MAG: DNA polymerase IV [Myxococcales bacterium]|nr:MAG: DNA polymerase IV [Myxococcales bacterium]